MKFSGGNRTSWGGGEGGTHPAGLYADKPLHTPESQLQVQFGVVTYVPLHTPESQLQVRFGVVTCSERNGTGCLCCGTVISHPQRWHLIHLADGAVAQSGSSIGSNWNGQILCLHITVKELIPMVLAAAVWDQAWQLTHIRVRSDNSAVEAIFNGDYSKDAEVMHLMRCFISWRLVTTFIYRQSTYGVFLMKLQMHLHELLYFPDIATSSQQDTNSNSPSTSQSPVREWLSTSWASLFNSLSQSRAGYKGVLGVLKHPTSAKTTQISMNTWLNNQL